MAFSFLKKLFGAEAKEAGPLPPMVDAAPLPQEEGDSGAAAPEGGSHPQCLDDLRNFVAFVVTSLVDKAFGSLCYDRELSAYPKDYWVKNLQEAILETEK